MKTKKPKTIIATKDVSLHQAMTRKNLEDHQSLLVSIINSTSDAIISKTPEGIITIWNLGAEKLFGYTAGEAIGKNISMLIPQYHTNEADDIIKNISNGKQAKQYETQWRRKDGSLIYVSLTLCAMKKAEGNMTSFSKNGQVIVATYLDTTASIVTKKTEETERKNPEENTHELISIKNELERSEKSLKEAQEMAHLGSWSFDLITNETNWTDETYKIFGIGKNEIVPSFDAFLSFIHPDDLGRVKKIIETGEKPLQQYSFNCRILRRDGVIRYVYADCRFVLDEKGKPVRIHGIIHDTTERQAAEDKLLHSESRLKQAQAIAHIGNWEINFATNISEWSDEAYRIYGLSPAEHQLSMEAWMSFIHPEDVEEVKKEIERSHASLSDFSFYHRIVRKDGVVRYVHTESKFEFDQEGKPAGLYGIVHDITDRKNNEQELKILNEQIIKRAEELAASNAELERFAYVASHDLQEPLRMVNSFLQLLQKKYKDQLDETARQYIGYAVDGAGRMKKLILDLLEYSRIGTNKDVLADTGINEVVTEVLETFSSKIRETGAVINVQPMPVVKASKMQITQLFQNLLSNALKYNTSFVPEIEIGCEDKGDVWQFSVKDNGIGIEHKFLDKVFIIFQRLHNKNQFSGTGIGLAICKKIAERHGGTIWIESQAGAGSVFFFTIKK